MLLKHGAQYPTYAAKFAIKVGNTPLTGDSMRRIYNHELAELHMPKAPRRDPKKEALARDGALNPRPEAIRDPLFVGNRFFDPDDLLQVRYEMVRRHRVDGVGVSEVAENYGVSRPTFYKSQSGPGRRRALRAVAAPTRPQRRSQDIRRRSCFRGRIQSRPPRSDDGAMSRRHPSAIRRQGSPSIPGTRTRAQKKRPRSCLTLPSIEAIAAYENLRSAVLFAGDIDFSDLEVVRRSGLAAWVRGLGSAEKCKSQDQRRFDPGTAQGPNFAPNELTRLIAGIILSLTMEVTPGHA
jgi:hypothetical protein